MMADIGAASLALTQAVSSFNAFLPKLSDIRKASPDSEIARDVRTGEVAAIVVTMSVGAVMSSLTSDPTPTYVGLVICIGLVAVYETTLRRAGERPAPAMDVEGELG